MVLDHLPKNLAKPWLKVSATLRLRPISCHAALVYYNWKLLTPDRGINLANLATLHTVSGGMDESWFYLVTVAIEGVGAAAIRDMTSAMRAVTTGDAATLASCLNSIASVINQMTAILMRMIENCDRMLSWNLIIYSIYFL